MPKVKVVKSPIADVFEHLVNRVLKSLAEFDADAEVVYTVKGNEFVAFIHYWETDEMGEIGWEAG